MGEARIVIASLGEGSVRLSLCADRELCPQLRRSGYLSRDGAIDPLEAAYQASRGRLFLDDGRRGWEAAMGIIGALSLDLDLFIVYRDLRRKGRKPRRGVRDRTLMYEFGGKVYEVLVLSEGYEISLRRLVEWSRQAVADGHVPIVAVVDRTGIITYYEARAFRSLQ